MVSNVPKVKAGFPSTNFSEPSKLGIPSKKPMKTEKIKPVAALISFFSGLGFLDLGFENAGFEISFVNEIHNAFLSGYKFSRSKLGYNEPECGYFEGSIEELAETRFRELNLIIKKKRQSGHLVGFIGGPPCPDFSVGGKNRGGDGDNGKLSGMYFDIICRTKPDFFLFENVDGLLKTEKHRVYYNSLKEQVIKAHYSLSDTVINCVSYNVPQDRRRVFLFGTSKSTFGKELFVDWNRYKLYPDSVLSDYPWPETSKFIPDSDLPAPNDIPLSLTVQHWFTRNQVEKHPNSHSCFRPKAGLPKMELIAEGDDSRKSYKRLHRWRYSPAAAYGNNEVHLHPYKVRRINASEALAIQSIPNCFQLPENMTLTDMFKGIGNGVPYLAAKGVAQTIRDFLEASK